MKNMKTRIMRTVLSLLTLTVALTSISLAAALKPKLSVTGDCPPGTIRPYSYVVYERRDRDGHYDTKTVYGCKGGGRVYPINGQVSEDDGGSFMQLGGPVAAVTEDDLVTVELSSGDWAWSITEHGVGGTWTCVSGRDANGDMFSTCPAN